MGFYTYMDTTNDAMQINQLLYSLPMHTEQNTNNHCLRYGPLIPTIVKLLPVSVMIINTNSIEI